MGDVLNRDGRRRRQLHRLPSREQLRELTDDSIKDKAIEKFPPLEERTWERAS